MAKKIDKVAAAKAAAVRKKALALAAKANKAALDKAAQGSSAASGTTSGTSSNTSSSSSDSSDSSSQGYTQAKPVVATSTSTEDSTSKTTGNASSSIKIATSNLFLFEEAPLTAETMTDMIFEDIGGRELIDMVSGDMVYDLASHAAPNQPITNLSSIVNRYSPKNIVDLQGTSDKFFQSNFQLDINTYIPPSATDQLVSHVYVVMPENSSDNANSDLLDHLVIEVVNLDTANNERVEIQILSYDQVHNGTIY